MSFNLLTPTEYFNQCHREGKAATDGDYMNILQKQIKEEVQRILNEKSSQDCRQGSFQNHQNYSFGNNTKQGKSTCN